MTDETKRPQAQRRKIGGYTREEWEDHITCGRFSAPTRPHDTQNRKIPGPTLARALVAAAFSEAPTVEPCGQEPCEVCEKPVWTCELGCDDDTHGNGSELRRRWVCSDECFERATAPAPTPEERLTQEEIAEVIRHARMEVEGLSRLEVPFHRWPWHKRLAAVVLQLAAAHGSGERVGGCSCSVAALRKAKASIWCNYCRPPRWPHMEDESEELARRLAGSGEGRELRDKIDALMRKLIEGNFGPNPWQAGYSEMRAIAEEVRSLLRQGDAEGER